MKQSETKTHNVGKSKIKVIFLILSFIPSIIIGIICFNNAKFPESVDIDYAKSVWNSGISYIPYIDISFGADSAVTSEDIENNGLSNFSKKNYDIYITLENGDVLQFSRDRAEVISKSVFGDLNTYYNIDFSKSDPVVSKAHINIINDRIMLILGLIAIVFFTYFALCIIGMIIYIIKYNILK